MIPYARVYETEQNARDAVSKLTEIGVSADEVLFIEPSAGLDAVQKAIDRKRLPAGFRSVGLEAVESGHFIVAAGGGYGRGKALIGALNSAGPIKAASPALYEDSPSPFSDSLGLMVQFDSKVSSVKLLRHNFLPTFFLGLVTKSQKPWFGGLAKSKPIMGALTKSQKPWFGGLWTPNYNFLATGFLGLLTKSQKPWFGGLAKSKPIMGGLTKSQKPWFGGLSKPKNNWTMSFGFPLLSDVDSRTRRKRPDQVLYSRVYESESNARNAVSKLTAAGVPADAILLIEPSRGVDAVKKAVDEGKLPYGSLGLGTRAVEADRYIVSVVSVFGRGGADQAILDSCGAMDVEIPALKPTSPSPLSDACWLPVLADSRASTGLARNNFAATGYLGLVTKNGRPVMGWLSKSKPIMGGLTKSQKPWFGALSKPKDNWTMSFGFPLLSNNPASR